MLHPFPPDVQPTASGSFHFDWHWVLEAADELECLSKWLATIESWAYIASVSGARGFVSYGSCTLEQVAVPVLNDLNKSFWCVMDPPDRGVW